MANPRRLARAEKAGDDGTGDAGKRCSFSLLLNEIDGRHARDQPALENHGAPAPRHETVTGACEQPGAFDQRFGIARLIEPAEHVSQAPSRLMARCKPGCTARHLTWRTVTPLPSAAAPSARKQQAGAHAVLGIARAAAGHADIDRHRVRRLDVALFVRFHVAESHPYRRP